MKTISINILTIICIFLLTINAYSQTDSKNDDLEIEELTGTFYGFDEHQNLYLFSVVYEEDGIEVEDDYKFIITDKKIESKYNLKSETLKDKSFLIKYTVHVITEINDEEEEEFVEIYTIKDLLLIQ